MQDQIFSLKIDGAFCQIGLNDLQNLDQCAENFLKKNNLSLSFKQQLVQRFESVFEMFIQNEQQKEDKTLKKFYNNQGKQIIDDETEKQITKINQSYYETLKQSDRVFERLYKDSQRRKRKKQNIQKKKQNDEKQILQEQQFIQQQKENIPKEQNTDKICKQEIKKTNRFDELYQDAINQKKRHQQRYQSSQFLNKVYVNDQSRKILKESSIPRDFYHRVIYQKNLRQKSLNKIRRESQCSFKPKINNYNKNKSQDNIPHYQKLYIQSKKQKQKVEYNHKRTISQNTKSIVNIQVKALANQYFQQFKDIFSELIRPEQIDLNSIKPNRLQILTPLLLDMNQFNHEISKQQFECLFQQFYQNLNLFDKQQLQNNTRTKTNLTEHLFKPKLNPKSIKMAKNRKFNNLFKKQNI